MAERLKQIWSGFEGMTQRRLTGRGIDNIIPPQARGFDADMMSGPIEGLERPADRAATALRAQILKAGGKTGKNKASGARGNKALNGQHRGYGPSSQPGHASSDRRIDLSAGEASRFGAPSEAMDLLSALHATEMRVDRPDIDYSTFIETNAGREFLGARKRRKFLGIF